MKKTNFDGFENKEQMKKIKNLYEKIEIDPVLEKAFLQDEKTFVEKNGFNYDQVKEIIKEIKSERMAVLSEVLKEQEDKLK
jgi:pantoate kinase